MKHLRRSPRRRGRRVAAGVVVSALVTGLISMANTAGAAETVANGEVYGGGISAGAPWVLDFPNDQAPFVDVAVHALSGANHTTLAVTASGDIVTQGNYEGIVSLIPASLANENVIAIEAFRGRAAAVTQSGKIVTWSNAATPPAAYQNPTAPTGVVDVQLGNDFGVALKDDGTIDTWGNSGFVSRTPDLDDVVQIDANRNSALALTADGTVHTWGTSNNVAQANGLEEVNASRIVDIAMSSDAGWALTEEGEVLDFGALTGGINPRNVFPTDRAEGPVIALQSNSGSSNWGGAALTEQGEFVVWGDQSEAADLAATPAPVELDEQQVVAFEGAPTNHTAVIFGPKDDEPEPGVVSPPAVDGFPVVGSDVTGTPATFNFEPTSATSAWYRAPSPETPAEDWTLIGETNPLELTSELEGQYVAYRTTVEGPEGATFTADSTPIGPIESAPPGVVDEAKIEGIPVRNTQLIGIAATFNFTPESVVSEWYRADSADADPETWTLVSSANPLTVATANEGKFLFFRTTATDEGGQTFVSNSAPMGPIVRFTGAPSSIQGDPLVGSTITGVPGEFTYPPESMTYFWRIGDDVINVAEGGSLDLVMTEDYVGKTVMFFAQGRVAGLLATSFSPAIGPVTLPPLSAVEVPQVEGIPVRNTQLIGIAAVFNRPPESVVSEWYRADSADADPEDWELVSSANPLTVATANEGKFLFFRTTATDEGGQTFVSNSAPMGPIVRFTSTPSSIQGEAVVGSTITAVPGEFTYPPESVTYRWLIGSTPIEIPQGGSLDLTLTEDYVGKTIQFFAQGKLAGLNSTSFSPAFGPVTLPPLELSGQPTVTGQPFIGETLTATPVDTPDGVESTLQWFAGSGDTFTAIDGATGETFELTEAQRDQQVKVVQTATRAADDATATAESVPTAAVTDAPVDLVVEAGAELSGTPIVGETLTGTPAVYSTTEDVTVTNYWVIGDEEVEADGTTLVLTDEHVGLNIQFKSVATRGEEAVPSVSSAVGPVLVVLEATSPPTITGTPEVGQTLNGAPATFSDTDGVTVTNQWFADGDPIDGATTTALVLTEDHLGAEITFVSTATRGDETPVVSESDPTAPVEEEDTTTPPGGEVVIDLDGATAPGATISVQVGTGLAGQQVQVYLSNLDRLLGPVTVAEDGTIQVLVPGDIPLGTHRLAVYAEGQLVGWDDFEVTLVRPEDPAFQDLINVSPDPVKAGDEVTIQVGADRAGQQVRVVLFSTPRDLGFVTVAADGTVKVTIPADMAAGVHRVAVYDATGALIGWQDVTVAGDGSSGSGSGAGNLPSTGAGDVGPMIPLGLTLLLAGLGLLAYRARGRHLLS